MSKLSNICTVTPRDLKRNVKFDILTVLEEARKDKDRFGIFIWGEPGIAKSSLVKEIAREINFHIVDIRLSQKEPSDLSGIPFPITKNDEDGNMIARTIWATPQSYPIRDTKTGLMKELREPDGEKILNKDGKPFDGAIIFLDELPNSPESVQNAAYQIVLDGRIGDYILPKNVIVVAAGNRMEDRSGTTAMPTALRNRFIHYNLIPSALEWIEDFAFPTKQHQAVVSYISAHPEKIHGFDPKSSSNAFNTPRSWTALSTLLLHNERSPDDAKMKSFDIYVKACGLVGDGEGAEFYQHYRVNQRLPRPIDILTGKVKTFNMVAEGKNYEESSKGKKGDERVVETKSFTADISLMHSAAVSLAMALIDIRKEVSTPKQKKDFDSIYFNNYLAFMINPENNIKTDIVIANMRFLFNTHKVMPYNNADVETWPLFMAKHRNVLLAK